MKTNDGEDTSVLVSDLGIASRPLLAELQLELRGVTRTAGSRKSS